MAQVSPIIHDGILTDPRNGSPVLIVVDSSDWYAWLQTASTFTFRGEEGLFTAHKERAGNRRGRAYWRAYRTWQGKLHRAYLGHSEELTLEQLKSVAVALANKGERENSLVLPGLEGETRPSPDSSSRARTHRRRASEAYGLHKAVRSEPWLTSLPVPLTALIGREQEVRAICNLLLHPEVRLLTITGTGGVGKTRLALEVAGVVCAEFSDGACFVSLAPVSDPDRVMATIAQALGLWEVAELSPEDQVHAALRERHLLLLLDNFEQVIQAAPPLASLLASCPRLRLLVTSRAALHLSGEHEFPVLPLAVPDLTHLPEPETLSQQVAVRLFVLRTQAIQPTFDVIPANARAIAEICVYLDGLPLAIELAAARSKLLPPQALLKRLSHRLEVLTGGARDLPAHQQTLRNTLQWSYDLLSQEEQRLFRRLSVFVGGCTLEAAEAVCQEGSEQAFSVLECISSLLDKSLVQQTEREGETPRFVMLETLREFGLACLHGSGELEAAREAHAHYYLELAEAVGLEVLGPQRATGLDRLEQEHDNLRAALQWGLEEATEQVAERRELALRLSAALEAFWLQHGHYREARAFLEQSLARSEGEDTPLRARVLQVAAWFAIVLQGDHERAEVLAKQSLALYRVLDETRGIARSLFLLGRAAWVMGKTTEALSHSEERLRLLRQIGEPGEVADALFHLATQLSTHGEYTRGETLFEEALLLFRKAGNELMIGATLIQSALTLWFAQGDVATIRQRLQEGQAFINKVSSRHWSAESSVVTALLSFSEGEMASAASLIQESLAIYRDMDSRWFIAFALHCLGMIEAQRGDLRAARNAYQESLAVCLELGEQFNTPFNMEGLAGVAAAQGSFRWAAQLWGAAEALRVATALPLPPVYRAGYEQAIHAARVQLGATAFAAAWQEGRTMTPAQALAAQMPATISPPTSAGALSTPSKKKSATSPGSLTAREVEVLRLVAQGLSDAQVAEQLVISPRTVNWHLTSIYSKLQVSSRSAATRYAIAQHLV
jgi:predicted ATPase/DNA-binding CsgD family transcriptional regulator